MPKIDTEQVTKELQSITFSVSDARRAVMVARRLQVVGRGPRGTVGTKFIEETARDTHIARSTIYRDIARADVLGINGLMRIEKTSLDHGGQLDALIRLPPEEREDLMKRAAAGERVSAISKPKKGRR